MQTTTYIDQLKLKRLKIIAWIILSFVVLLSGLSVSAIYREIELWNGFFFYLLYPFVFLCLMTGAVIKPFTLANYNTARVMLVSTFALFVLPEAVILIVLLSTGNFPE